MRERGETYTQAERDAYIDGHDAGYDAGWKAAIAALSANGNLRKPVQGDEVVIQEHTVGVVTATDDREAVQALQPNGAAIWVPAGAYRITGDKYELYDKLIEQLNRADMEFKNANVESD